MGQLLHRAFVLIAVLCALSGVTGYAIGKFTYESQPTPLTDEEKAAANVDRLLAEFYAKKHEEAPANVLGAPGSTRNEAVGVWVDPLTGCHYITGGGAAPVYTPRMRLTLSGMYQVCDKD